MTERVLFLLKTTTLAVSAVVNLVSADPRGFYRKAMERIRQSGPPVLAPFAERLGRRGSHRGSRARRLIDAGLLSEGVRAVVAEGHRTSSGDIHLARRTLERMEQLQRAPYSGVPINSSARAPRVLHVLTNSEPYTNSGYTVRSHAVLRCQAETGIETRAVTRLGYPVLVGKLPKGSQQTIDGVVYRRLLPWIYPRSLRQRDRRSVKLIVREARLMNATALHTTTDYTNALVVSEAARLLNIPWVYEVRGELENTWLSRQPVAEQAAAEHSEFYLHARQQETRCMQACSAVVALSEVSKRQIIDRGVPPEKITVVPNAVDSSLIGKRFNRSAIREELGLPVSKLLVGTVTAVVDYEGLDTLLEAVTLLPEEWEVLIVGEGVSLPRLKDRAKAMGIGARVHFVGRQPNDSIWKWYAALDVFALSRKDTTVTRTVTPIKPLVAMALGIPLVCSDLPALRDVTGGAASFVPAEDPEALARAIRSEHGMTQAGIDVASGKTWAANGRRYRQVYTG